MCKSFYNNYFDNSIFSTRRWILFWVSPREMPIFRQLWFYEPYFCIDTFSIFLLFQNIETTVYFALLRILLLFASLCCASLCFQLRLLGLALCFAPHSAIEGSRFPTEPQGFQVPGAPLEPRNQHTRNLFDRHFYSSNLSILLASLPAISTFLVYRSSRHLLVSSLPAICLYLSIYLSKKKMVDFHHIHPFLGQTTGSTAQTRKK